MKYISLAFSLLFLTHCTSSPPPDVFDATAIDAIDRSTVLDASDAFGATSPPVDVPLPWLIPYTPSPRAHFPAQFLWGSATAPYQVEGGLSATDWAQWEAMGRIAAGDRADDGPRSLQFYQNDLDALVAMHQNAYRFGIEWSRLFPTASAWAMCRNASAVNRAIACRAAADPAGVQYYHDMLDALHARAITPLVTLQHFTLPTYINDLSQDWQTQGWMNASIVDDLATYASFTASEYGGSVDWWITLNEPTAFAMTAYLVGIHPPGRQFQSDAMPVVHEHMIRAHVAMYDAIHAADTLVASNVGPIAPARPAMVSIAHNAPRYYPQNPADARDVMIAGRNDQIFNHTFFDAVVRGNLDRNMDGTLDADEPHADPSLLGRADYVGVNYYSAQILHYTLIVPFFRSIPILPGVSDGLPMSDLGLDIHPRGMFDTVTWAGAYGLPVLVTENGLADRSDANRPRFIAEHLAALAAAIQSGVNVLGYFHWATIDNFEWSSGFCPHFGLYSIDYASPNRTRTARASAAVYSSIIMAGEVTDALLTAQPAYQMPSSLCSFNLSIDAGL